MEEEPKYIEGFNAGYKMMQFQPTLVEKLRPTLSEENDYERGILEGIQQYEREMEKTQERENELNAIREENKEQNKEIDREDE